MDFSQATADFEKCLKEISEYRKSYFDHIIEKYSNVDEQCPIINMDTLEVIDGEEVTVPEFGTMSTYYCEPAQKLLKELEVSVRNQKENKKKFSKCEQHVTKKVNISPNEHTNSSEKKYADQFFKAVQSSSKDPDRSEKEFSKWEQHVIKKENRSRNEPTNSSVKKFAEQYFKAVESSKKDSDRSEKEFSKWEQHVIKKVNRSLKEHTNSNEKKYDQFFKAVQSSNNDPDRSKKEFSKLEQHGIKKVNESPNEHGNSSRKKYEQHVIKKVNESPNQHTNSREKKYGRRITPTMISQKNTPLKRSLDSIPVDDFVSNSFVSYSKRSPKIVIKNSENSYGSKSCKSEALTNFLVDDLSGLSNMSSSPNRSEFAQSFKKLKKGKVIL